jgi:hypothetical protein
MATERVSRSLALRESEIDVNPNGTAAQKMDCWCSSGSLATLGMTNAGHNIQPAFEAVSINFKMDVIQ